MIIGIDPGMSGGVAILDEYGNVQAFPMPVKEKQIDIATLSLSVMFEDVELIAIEKVHAFPGQGVTSMFNFGVIYGMLLAWSYIISDTVIEVSPRKWMKNFPGEGKERSISFVQKNYPQVNLLPGRKKVPHDGMADAVCIAHYAFNNLSKKV